MRSLTRFVGWLKWFRKRLHWRVYQLKQYLNYQRVAGLMMLFISISLASSPSVILNRAFETAGLTTDSYHAALVFMFSAGLLVGRMYRSFLFRVITLPLIVYSMVYVWSFLTTGTGMITAIYGIGIWVLLQIAATQPIID